MSTNCQDGGNEPPVTVSGAQLQQLRSVGKLLERLPKDCSTTFGSHNRTGRGPDRRTLWYANYCGLMLLGVLHPAIESLNDIQRASELKRVRQALTPEGKPLAARTSRGSLSESVRVFDPELLQPIIAELASRLPKNFHPENTPVHEVPIDLLQKVVAVDGSCLQGLSQIIAAQTAPKKQGGQATWRMHMQFRPLSNLPDPTYPAVLTPDRTAAEDDERAVLARHLQAGCVYVGDRGYEKYDLFNEIVDAGSDYVVRVQKRSMKVVEDRPLTPEAAKAGVIEDQIVTTSRSYQGDPSLCHTVRRIVIQLPRHAQGKPRTDQQTSEETTDQIVLLTSLIDVPAEVIGAVYRLRWSIETFFRFFKHVLGLKRLFSEKTRGVQIQIAMAIIAALLMTLACGRSIGRTGQFALQMFLSGMADEAEVIALLKRDAAEQARKTKP
jgi:hypothetical protein